jgi:hypothetical protein
MTSAALSTGRDMMSSSGVTPSITVVRTRSVKRLSYRSRTISVRAAPTMTAKAKRGAQALTGATTRVDGVPSFLKNTSRRYQ